MKFYAIVCTVIAASIAVGANGAFAISPFKKSFDAKYVKKSDNTDFQAAFKKASCNTCHVKGKKKDYLNDYGLKLAELIKGNVKDQIDEAKKAGTDAKKAKEAEFVKEFEAALKKVEAKKGPDGKTYAELFKAHSLPSADGAKSIR